uniref:Nef protein n=1 Tax=Human immunodeficiency virus type 1 TaxID=11676 RepID=H6CYJ8_HV1|nr:nef protein [Human immunodeficiency virus 1]AFB38277.1 nef protein [Human immunodeficiency virus 1]
MGGKWSKRSVPGGGVGHHKGKNETS